MFDIYMVRYTYETVFKKSEQPYARALGIRSADIKIMLDEMTDTRVRPKLARLTLEYHAVNQEHMSTLLRSYKRLKKASDKRIKHCQYCASIRRAGELAMERSEAPNCTGFEQKMHRAAAALIRFVEIVFCGTDRARCIFYDDGEIKPVSKGTRGTSPCDMLEKIVKHLPNCLIDSDES